MSALPDIPRTFTALAEWLACLVLMSGQSKRLSRPLFWGVAVVWFVVQAAFLQLTDSVPLGWWLPCMIIAVGLMYLFIWICCDITPVSAGYQCAWAFIVAEFAASLEWLAFCVAFPGTPALGWLSVLCMAAGYGAIYGGFFWLRSRPIRQPAVGTRVLAAAVLMAVVVFAVSNVGFLATGSTATGTHGLYYIRTLVDFAGLLILAIYHRQLQDNELRQELSAMDNTLHRQYEQYKASRENIRLLNRRYHDLKVQIAAIRAEQDPGRQAQFLDELESGLARFEAENKTGNPVLDTILTAKSMYCADHGITLTCVADGALLSFLTVQELSSIFSTILDNAVDSVRPLPKEQRLIRLAVFAQKGFLMIRCENTVGGSLRFENGLPVSAKPAESRNYGLKNLLAVAERHGGTLTTHAEDGWFYLRLLMPLHQG